MQSILEVTYSTCQRNQCHSTWNTYEEKMTDVNIAPQLIMDAYEDCYETAIIVSGDSDLATPLSRLNNAFLTNA